MILQRILNKYLQADPNLRPALLALENKTFSITCTSVINLQLYWTFNNGVLLCSSSAPDHIDTVIASTLEGYLKFLALKQHHNIIISGDAILANALQKIFNSIEIDWEEELSHHTGDIVAHKIFQIINYIKNYQQESRQSVAEMLSEYLQQESGLLPTAFEINDFVQQVDELRLRVDRCEARVNAYENN